MNPDLTSPEAWVRAFNQVPYGYKWVAAALLAGFIFALICKWWPRTPKGRLP